MISRIADWLVISNYRASLDRTLLEAYSIAAILHLAHQVTHPNVTTLYLPVEDGQPIADPMWG